MLPTTFNTPKFFNSSKKITSISLIRRIAGTSGTTRVDILANGTSIFSGDSEKPQVQASAGNYAIDIATANIVLPSGSYIEAQLETIESGNPEDIRVSVTYL